MIYHCWEKLLTLYLWGESMSWVITFYNGSLSYFRKKKYYMIFYMWFICIYVSAHNDLNHRRKRLLVKFTPALRQNVRTWGRLELYLDNLGELIKYICTSQPLVWWCDRTGAWHSNNFLCSAFVNAFHLSGYQWVLPFMCLLS